MKFQSEISSLDGNGYGRRRYMPYVYMEQGISMLASVLRSEITINASIRIMRTFVEIRRFIANNALLFERISNVEKKPVKRYSLTDRYMMHSV